MFFSTPLIPVYQCIVDSHGCWAKYILICTISPHYDNKISYHQSPKNCPRRKTPFASLAASCLKVTLTLGMEWHALYPLSILGIAKLWSILIHGQVLKKHEFDWLYFQRIENNCSLSSFQKYFKILKFIYDFGPEFFTILWRMQSWFGYN